MDRIQGVTVAPGNQFTEGDPGTAVPATIVSALWLNGVQEELVGVIEAAAITPSDADNRQVLDALNALYAPKASTDSRLDDVEASSTSLIGKVARLQSVNSYRLTVGSVSVSDSSPSTFPFPSINVGDHIASASVMMTGGVPADAAAEYGQRIRMLLRKNGVVLKEIEFEWYYKNLNHYGGVSQTIIMPPTPISVGSGDDYDIQIVTSARYGFTSMQAAFLDLVLQGLS